MPHEIDRFVDKVLFEPNTGHWVWLAHKNRQGYGRFRFDGRMGLAHQFAYEHYVRPLVDGERIVHLCRVRACVNYAHMEAVGQQLTGQDLRAWRLAWGMRGPEVATRLYYGRFAIPMMEARGPLPVFVAEYMRAYPPPPDGDPAYPATPEGLAAALTALGMGYSTFARWWGTTGPMGVWHWLHGNAALPIEIQAWLRAGAPRTGRPALPPPAGHAERPGAPPPRPRASPVPDPRRRPAPDWVWLTTPRGWVPPAGACAPGETYGALRHCGVCAWRSSCRELTRAGRAS